MYRTLQNLEDSENKWENIAILWFDIWHRYGMLDREGDIKQSSGVAE
jgi:hypothetical protein